MSLKTKKIRRILPVKTESRCCAAGLLAEEIVACQEDFYLFPPPEKSFDPPGVR